MQHPPELERAVRDLIMDLCGVLYSHGYQEISVGALMRVIGIPAERAAEHDHSIINISSQFSALMPRHKNLEVPPGTVFH